MTQLRLVHRIADLCQPLRIDISAEHVARRPHVSSDTDSEVTGAGADIRDFGALAYIENLDEARRVRRVILLLRTESGADREKRQQRMEDGPVNAATSTRLPGRPFPARAR